MLALAQKPVQIQKILYIHAQKPEYPLCTGRFSANCTPMAKTSTPQSDTAGYLYRQLESRLREEIRSGRRAHGERLPSVRELCRQAEVSKSTVLAAYQGLESEGLIEARPRSGFFVSSPTSTATTAIGSPALSQPLETPAPVSADQVLLDIMVRGAAFDMLPASGDEADNESLRRCLTRAQRQQRSHEQLYYDQPMGSFELRQQLALRMAQGGAQVSADQLVVTAGCQHALLLALMATTCPGDVVAIESPGFYGAFQLLETLGLQALELPSSAETGISPDALELALQHWPVKALLVSPCYATPTGACMPENNKQRLLALTQSHGIAVIEDDIYGELHFGPLRPRSLYSYDDSGSVLLCSSFSKSLSRDLRLGWIAPGKYRQQVERLKLVTALATSSSLQQGVCEFMQHGGLERHLRQRRSQYRQQYQQLLSLLPQYLPQTVSCSRPEGGLALWLELPEQVCSVQLYGQARAAGIIITPGRLFTAQQRYQNFLRLSFAHPWTQHRQQALKRLGELITEQL